MEKQLQRLDRGLLWWSSGRESTSRCGRHRYDPWSEKIPQAVEQRCLCVTTPEPSLWSPGTPAAEAQMVQLLTKDIYRDQWNLIENRK